MKKKTTREKDVAKGSLVKQGASIFSAEKGGRTRRFLSRSENSGCHLRGKGRRGKIGSWPEGGNTYKGLRDPTERWRFGKKINGEKSPREPEGRGKEVARGH